MGNSFIFPASPSSYKAADVNGLFWVPERLGSESCSVKTLDRLKGLYESRGGPSATPMMWIPCQYLPATTTVGEKHVILYFHGNSCDLGDMCEEMQEINFITGRHVVQMEYPGYGLCQHLITRPDVIDHWARAVLKMLLICGVELWQIYIMGRSIGTGPAATLTRWCVDSYVKGTLPGKNCSAMVESVLRRGQSGGALIAHTGVCSSQRSASDQPPVNKTISPLGGLILHSPYKSLHKVVNDYVWNVVTYLVPNYWDIEKELAILQNFNVPLLVIHGLNDEVIAVSHGRDLLKNYTGSHKFGVFSPTSLHNSYDVANDVALPIRQLISTSAQLDYAHVCATRQIIPLWAHKLQPPTRCPTRQTSNDQSQLGPISRLLFCGCGGLSCVSGDAEIGPICPSLTSVEASPGRPPMTSRKC